MRVHERAKAGLHPWLSRRLLDELVAKRDALEPGTDALRRIGPMTGVAHYRMVVGDLERAVADYRAVLELMRADARLGNAELAAVEFGLAVTWFRQGERQNCIAHHTSESCIFPLRGGAIHVEPTGADRSRALLLSVLERDPTYLEAAWLLNVAHMALGDWPAGVPDEWLCPPDRIASQASAPRFVDRGPRLGINRRTRAGGAVLDDFDGDGRLDVATSSFDTATPVALYLQRGGGRFEDVGAARGLGGQLGGGNLVHSDFDGDGRLDLLVLRGAGLGAEGSAEPSLLLQQEDGRFEDRTAEAGLAVAAPTSCVAVADVDLDGDLDLFVGRESEGVPGTRPAVASALYLDRGGARYERVDGPAALEGVAGAAFGDVDGDLLPDLYVSNHRAPNQLFLNRGAGRFELVERGVSEPRYSGATGFFDVDNDGDLDLFVGYHGYGSKLRNVADYYFTGNVPDDTQRLFSNDGTGHFRDVTEEYGLKRITYSLGFNFGDLDGDGFLDLYLGTGAAEMAALWPNVALRNVGGTRFADVTETTGLGHLQKGNAVCFGDVDADGDQDVLVQTGGVHLDDGFGDVLFENQGRRRASLALDLVGAGANTRAIGARIRVDFESGGEARTVYAHVGCGGSLGGNSLRQELGLGDAAGPVDVEVRWPRGDVTRHVGIPLGGVVVLREEDPGPSPRTR